MGNVNWMRARESQLASELFGIDLQKVMPVVRPGGSDSATFDNVLELLMLGGPLAAARGDDDDPGGLPRPRRPARAPQGLLRLPRVPDGAVGRPGVGLLHRRPRRRRDAGPQRPAPRALGRDEGRPRDPRLRGRDAADRRPRTSSASAAWRRASCSSSTSRRAGSSRTTRSSAQVATQRPVRRVGRRATSCTSTTCRRSRRDAAATSRCARCQLAFGYTQEDLRVLITPMATARRGADRLDGQRQRARRALATSARRCSPTSSSCSRR